MLETTPSAVAALRKFVRQLVSDGVPNKTSWKDWRNNEGNATFMAECFQYERLDGMPDVTDLLAPFFHPELPLIGLNYSKVAHNVLHHYPTGWTPVLKLCRGMVFDRRGSLAAFAFPKFFNNGELVGAASPDLPFEATVKEDGHLLIIFWYRGQLIGTTRGSFVSPTAQLAEEILKGYAQAWKGKLPETMTLLAEFIHPETKVHLDYNGLIALKVIGAYNNRSYRDLDHERLTAFAEQLGLPVVQAHKFESKAALIKEVSNKTFRNIEGWVLRYSNGEREKFKDKGYIGVMIAAKINPAYIMNRIIEGNFESKMADLDGEVQMLACEVREQILGAISSPGTKKQHWQALYELFPEEDRTDYRKGICRTFYKFLVDSGQIVPLPEPVKVKAAKKKKTK